jgi:hypothetical protein
MMKLAAVLLLAALPQEKKIAWRSDYEAALKDAKKDGKLVVVHFSGPN